MNFFDYCTRKLGILTLLPISLCMAPFAQAEKGEWIDVHVHPMAQKGSKADFEQVAETLLNIMDSQNIKSVILMPPPAPTPNMDIADDLAAIKAKYGSRFAFMAGGTIAAMIYKNRNVATVPDDVRQRFEAFAEAQIAKGAIGFGEIPALHVSYTPTHPFIEVSPDHPLMLLLADIAARHDVPIDLHCDPIPEDMPTPSKLYAQLNPPQLKANLAATGRLLDHNPKARFVWAHLGSHPTDFLSLELTRVMLKRHPNLFFSIRPFGGDGYGDMVTSSRPVDKKWLALFQEFPDRFVLGTDTFQVSHNWTANDSVKTLAMGADKNRAGNSMLLHSLPDDLARKIGYENAQRIYKLKE